MLAIRTAVTASNSQRRKGSERSVNLLTLNPDIIPVPTFWFSTEVLSSIKPNDASNLVEENPEIWETSVAAWRQKHPPEPIPLARIQIRLTQKCEIVLTGQNGQTAAFFLKSGKLSLTEGVC